MKLSKQSLEAIIRDSIDMEGESHFAFHVLESLRNGVLEIEGYEKSEWIKFDPNDPKTFPPKGNDQFLTLSNDGEIRSMRFDFDTALVWKYHISHWRPLPNLPVEKEAKNEAE